MGAWSTSVTGNDVAQDMRDEFRAAFALNAPEDAVKKLDAYAKQAFLSDEWTDYLYALADFMEKNGVLTEDVRARAIASIDSGEDLARWNGESKSRKMALKALRARLIAPRTAKRKIRLPFEYSPFEAGDLIALRLNTMDSAYDEACRIPEKAFRALNGKYVIVRKLGDWVGRTLAVEPSVQDRYPVFELYRNTFDRLPDTDALKALKPARKRGRGGLLSRRRVVFWSEAEARGYRGRGTAVIGRNANGIDKMPEMKAEDMILISHCDMLEKRIAKYLEG